MKTYKHRGPGHPHANERQVGQAGATPEAAPEPTSAEEGDGLDSMTARELQAAMTARGLDIPRRATKAVMIAALREGESDLG